MPIEFSYAAVSPFYIAAMIIYALYSLYKASKKKEQKKGAKPNSKPRPGKSIEEVLRELERRVSGETEIPSVPPIQKEQAAPSLSKPKNVASTNPREKSIAEFKAENHSIKQNQDNGEELVKEFDEEKDRLTHHERNEEVVSYLEHGNQYTIDDIRRGIILDAILNRPEY